MASVTVAATGDLYIMRDDPDSMFAHTRDILSSVDIAFAQLETPYSEKGSQGSSGFRGTVRKDPHNRKSIANAGYSVISLASNHSADWGYDALLDCIDNLRAEGVTAIGAGKNISEARQPAIVERNGKRIAFLSYCSVAPEGYYAASNKPGCAPMRAIAHFEALEYDQPGTPARTMTFPVQADLEALLQDVRAAKAQADYVAVSLHWGIHIMRAVIADYQPVVAHAIIDAGADIIFGHHPHILKAVEVYQGKAIFYSLGNFAFDDPMAEGSLFNTDNPVGRYYRPFLGPNPSWESPHTMIAKWIIGDGQNRVSFVPCLINQKHEPVPLDPSTPEGKAMIDFISDITEEVGMDTGIYAVNGAEVVISGASA
jgi:poly-gamma-glutamate synthesis protein (capsule biosynthesis protein)